MKALSAFEQAALQTEVAELKEERNRLRTVYWESRAVLRYNGNGRPRWKCSTIIDWIQRQEQAA